MYTQTNINNSLFHLSSSLTTSLCVQTPAPSHHRPFLLASGFNLELERLWALINGHHLNLEITHFPIWEVSCPAMSPICPRMPGPPAGGALSSPSPMKVGSWSVTPSKVDYQYEHNAYLLQIPLIDHHDLSPLMINISSLRSRRSLNIGDSFTVSTSPSTKPPTWG